jgi:colanic acid biosynthesis protein WcaH
MRSTPRWTFCRGLIASPAFMHPEPEPGARLGPEDFENVIRLTPLVSIDMVIRSSDGRVLVGRRNHEPAKGCFFVPGGRITKNETVAAAFRRLTLVEPGVEKQIEEARFLGVYEHFYPTNRFERGAFGTHYVVLGYELTSPVKDALLPKEQHGEYAWRTEAELLNNPEVHEHTKAYFRRPTARSAH